jgi:hypothetical protein
MSCTRLVVLITGTRKRTYPLSPDVPLRDDYWIDANAGRWSR